MNNRLILALFSFCMVPFSSNTVAQEADSEELSKQIQIFTGVLQEGLDLDSTPGFLGISSGRVTNLYLRNQGVLFEVRTPLANQRNRVSLNALASSIRGISGVANPFEVMTRAQSGRPASASQGASQASTIVIEAAQNAAASLRAIDYQASVDAAMRDAYRGARMLQDIGGMDEQAVADLRQELDSLGQQLGESLQRLRQLESDVADNAEPGSTEAEPLSPGTEQRMEQLRLALEDLGEQAQQKSAELSEQYQQAKEEYRQRWQQDILAFEDSLFSVLCDYGATLRALPADEHVTVVLVGLGADTEQALPADRLHVVAKADLLSCQAGELDWQALRQRAASYNY